LDGERKRKEEKGELKGEDCKNWGTWGKLKGENPFSCSPTNPTMVERELKLLLLSYQRLFF
jgi:hypothetical protein